MSFSRFSSQFFRLICQNAGLKIQLCRLVKQRKIKFKNIFFNLWLQFLIFCNFAQTSAEKCIKHTQISS